MSIYKTPWTAESLTIEWISSILSTIDEYTSNKITGLRKEIISEGRGFSGEVWRIQLLYESHPKCSKSIVAKFSSRKTQTQRIVKRYAMNEVEIYHNKKISGNRNIFPQCFYAETNVDTGQVCLIIEDLKKHHEPDNVTGITIDEAFIATEGIAEFQSRWWNDTKINQLKWLRSPRVLSGMTSRILKKASEAYLEMYGSEISLEFNKLVRAFPDKSKQLLTEISQPPVTIAHGDFRPDNFFFEFRASRSRIIAIDWQLVSKLRGVTDISYLSAWGIPSNIRSSEETHILNHYHETIAKHGITDYPLDKLALDYKLGFLYALQVILIASFNLMDNTEREKKLIGSVNNRMDSIVQDHNLLQLLKKI